MTELITFWIALLLTFWGRKLALAMFRGVPRRLPRALLANAASFLVLATISVFVHASNLQLVNPSAAVIYLLAQAVWTLVDWISTRPTRARR